MKMQNDDTIRQVVSHNAVRNKPAILTMVFFLAAMVCVVLTYILEAVFVYAVLALLLIIASVAAASRITESKRVEDISVIHVDAPSSAADIKACLSDEDGEQLLDVNGDEVQRDTDECFIMSLKVNQLFTTLPLLAEVADERYTFPESVLSFTSYLKSDRDRELSRYAALRPDKTVVGLEDDINVATFSDLNEPISIHRVSRSAVQVTDDSLNKVIINKLLINNKVVFDGRTLLFDGENRIYPLSTSPCANEIDLHSLIISNDGYLMFRRGRESHPLFPNKAISSIACSLLPEEIDFSRPIQESMVRSIHNKIHVLYNLPEGVKLTSSSCGYARIISRCGAPEFYFVTRIDLSKEEIVTCHRDETAVFVDEMLDAVVPQLDTAENAASYIACAIADIRTSMPNDISLSTGALLLAAQKGFEDTVTAGKILRRLGLVENEFADNPYYADSDEARAAFAEAVDTHVDKYLEGEGEDKPSEAAGYGHGGPGTRTADVEIEDEIVEKDDENAETSE